MNVLDRIKEIFREKSNECEEKMNSIVDNVRAYTESDLEECRSRTWADALSLLCSIEADLKSELTSDQNYCSTNNGWIPCSIRYPSAEECGLYSDTMFQVTVADDNGCKTMCMRYEYVNVHDKDVVGIWIWHGRVSPWTVIAWKPLDKPWNTDSVFTTGDHIRSLRNEDIAEWIWSHDELTHEAGRLGKHEILNWLNLNDNITNTIRR